MNFKTIIFDLGGVVIDLAPDNTAKAFAKHAGISMEDSYKLYEQHPDLFLSYEKGLISCRQFRAGVNEVFQMSLSDYQIDTAWNAMLGNIPIVRLELLSALRNKYRVAILSNTNSIHIKAFNKKLVAISGKSDLHYFADDVYFSHELKMRKPDEDIYIEVLNQSKTNAPDALFLDDTLANLDTANRIGIQTMHITHPDQILNLQSYV